MKKSNSTKNKTDFERPKLSPVYGSDYCLYSVIENKLSILYNNQEIIYNTLLEILEKLENGNSLK